MVLRADIVAVRGHDVQTITLKLQDPGSAEPFRFCAGQYLELLTAGELTVPLSIASAPQRLPELELHYRSTPGSAQAGALDALLASASSLQLRGPFGDVKVEPEVTRPLLLVAGGTGASQALSIIESLTLAAAATPVTLLACADSAADLYFRNRLPGTPRPWLQLHLVADKRRNADNAAIRWLRARAAALEGTSQEERIILCGSPAFVYAAADALAAGGCEETRLESDVFAYAPRS